MKNREFKVSIDNKETIICVRSPSAADQKEASKIYNQTFSDAIKAKAVIRAKIDELLEEQGLWDSNKQQQLSKLQSEILERERILAKGGIFLNEGKKIALQMKKLRTDVRDLIEYRAIINKKISNHYDRSII